MTLKPLAQAIVSYPRGVWDEARRVSWPGPKKVLFSTLLVLVIGAIAAVFVAVLDVAFTQAIAKLLS